MINYFFKNIKAIKVRFATTVFINIMRMGLSFIAGILVARGLGPNNFGNYSFLLTSFVAITGLLDLGSSSAFFTFISKRKRSKAFYFYYFSWLAVQFIVVVSIVSIIFPNAWVYKIWLGQAKGVILLAFLASFMTDKIWKTASLIGESVRATVTVQLHTIFLTSTYLGSVLVLFFLKYINIVTLFSLISLVYLIFSVLLIKKLKNYLNLNKIGSDTFAGVTREFKIYCMPLIIYSFASFFYSFADNWLLQDFGGAVQQGFYSVGLRFSSISLIATSSILSIFWKEIAEAHELNDSKRLHYLYRKTLRLMCFVASIGSCFLFPFSREVLAFTLGPKYEPAWLAVAIMFLFPIPQTIGQINGIYFYATGKTKVYSIASIAIMLVSVPITYFLLAPASALIPGLGLGSVGLALKMVIIVLVWTNIHSYIISKLSGWKFEFLYQLQSIGLLLCASFLTKIVVKTIFGALSITIYPLVLIVICIPMYMIMAAGVVYLFPGLAGFEREYINKKIDFIKKYIINIFKNKRKKI